MKKFEQPQYKIKDLVADAHFGQFVFGPLERGFGTTLGNALRRILLSSLPGASIYAIEVDGARHEFAALEGVVEDITSIILNLKDLVLKVDDEETGMVELKINVRVPNDSSNPYEVTGADIECPLGVEVINKDCHICEVAVGGEFNAILRARNSRGYITAENNALISVNQAPGLIYTDSKYSPVEKVSFSIDPTRVGQDASYELLTIDVTTNGSIKPQEAIAMAAHILIAHLEPILALADQETVSFEVMTHTEEVQVNEFLDKPIADLNLTQRSENGLRRANIALVSDICNKTKEEISHIRNLGKKSVDEIAAKLIEKGLNFKKYEE